ncbi:hypothetical protein H7R52_05490 [Weissella confusa]|uniref:Uncharacterized protein n=1 Tax=Weissella confusa TaxID=1583 RepID=A0A923SN01_WEICO|nr:hypothetical protein [Weissella confusa]
MTVMNRAAAGDSKIMQWANWRTRMAINNLYATFFDDPVEAMRQLERFFTDYHMLTGNLDSLQVWQEADHRVARWAMLDCEDIEDVIYRALFLSRHVENRDIFRTPLNVVLHDLEPVLIQALLRNDSFAACTAEDFKTMIQTEEDAYERTENPRHLLNSFTYRGLAGQHLIDKWLLSDDAAQLARDVQGYICMVKGISKDELLSFGISKQRLDVIVDQPELMTLTEILKMMHILRVEPTDITVYAKLTVRTPGVDWFIEAAQRRQVALMSFGEMTFDLAGIWQVVTSKRHHLKNDGKSLFTKPYEEQTFVSLNENIRDSVAEVHYRALVLLIHDSVNSVETMRFVLHAISKQPNNAGNLELRMLAHYAELLEEYFFGNPVHAANEFRMYREPLAALLGELSRYQMFTHFEMQVFSQLAPVLRASEFYPLYEIFIRSVPEFTSYIPQRVGELVLRAELWMDTDEWDDTHGVQLDGAQTMSAEELAQKRDKTEQEYRNTGYKGFHLIALTFDVLYKRRVQVS